MFIFNQPSYEDRLMGFLIKFVGGMLLLMYLYNVSVGNVDSPLGPAQVSPQQEVLRERAVAAENIGNQYKGSGYCKVEKPDARHWKEESYRFDYTIDFESHNKSTNQVDALITFVYSGVDMNIPGSYRASGTYDRGTRSLILNPTGWVNRPGDASDEEMLALEGYFSSTHYVFSGEIRSPNCGTFNTLRVGGA